MEEHLNLTDCSCPPISQEDVWAKFIVVKLSVPLVGSVGLLGNLAAIVVLSHPDMKSTFNQSLIALAVFEIIFLVLFLFCDHGNGTWLYTVTFPYFLYPLQNIVLSCESYLLMSIALERLIAVVRPLWYRTARLRLSSWYHALIFILPSVIISISLNIPRFFEMELVYVNVTDTNNITRKVRNFDVTPLRLDHDWIEYYIFWTRSLGTGVIPILFLLITNTAIYLSLKRQRPTTTTTTTINNNNNISTERNISVVTSVTDTDTDTDRRPSVFSILSECLGSSNETGEISTISTMLTEEQIKQNRRNLSNSARTLSAIVIMYIVCNLPRLLLNVSEYLYQAEIYRDYSDCGCVIIQAWFEVSIRLSHFLLTINSSGNFIIYWSVGEQFKSTLARQLRRISTKIKSGFSRRANSNRVDV